MQQRKLKLFTGSSNVPLAREVCEYLNMRPGEAQVTVFSDGETRVKIEENVRGMDIFVIQSTAEPVNHHLVELLILIDAVKRASAARITAVLPYYGYARQDRKDEPRVPISAKLVADLITTAGAERILTMDLHAGQIQGFFNIPVDHLYAMPILLEYVRKKNLVNPVVVSPDAGGVERARAFAKRLGASLAIIDKRREGVNRTRVMNIIGDVKGRDVLILDDMIDTAGTITQGADAIHQHGARKILAASTHGILSGPAVDRLTASPIEEVVVTNTVPLHDKETRGKKVTVLSVAPLIGEAIRRIHREESLTSLFV